MNARSVLRVLLPIVILGLGGFGAKTLMSMKKPPTRAPKAAVVAAVEYVVVRAGAPAATVLSTGTVEGDRSVSLSALVAGEVVWVSDALTPGGRFRAGEAILRVDPRDYEVAVTQERSRVRQAELERELEEQRQETAAREWNLLGGGQDAGALALRKPQLETVERALEGARAGLQRAETNLERTTMKAPFNVMVLTESAEKGQLLAPGAPVVSLVGTDRFRVKIAVPLEQLANVAIPGVNGSTGAAAQISQDLPGSAPIVRAGSVIGLAGQLNAQTRTAEIYVGIDDPLDGPAPVPLLPGAFVTAAITGRAIDGALTVPRVAVIEGSFVWTIDANDALHRAPVQVGGADREELYIVGGLVDGDRVVVTPMSLPLEGQVVRGVPLGQAPTAAADPATPGSEG